LPTRFACCGRGVSARFALPAILSNLGTWEQQVAEPWRLLSLGASSFLIGLDCFTMAARVWY
jgi:hypothetical protein